MRYLTQDEISHALARGHSERSKQFHFVLSRLFGANTATSGRRTTRARTAVKTRVASV
nr:hypothetical protein [uncultured Cohaesibacter sp.]